MTTSVTAIFETATVWIRGAGELGSAAAATLFRSGFPVIISDLPYPLAIRRPVTFSDALLTGKSSVEAVPAARCSAREYRKLLSGGILPVCLDNPDLVNVIKPRIIVDCRMLKKPVDGFIDRAVFTIGLGPGFTAGVTCHAVIETMRGPDLGLIIHKGSARPDTGIPGAIGGETLKRLIRAPATGTLTWKTGFGKLVQEGDIIGLVNGSVPIRATLSGMVRGLINPLVPVTAGMKIGDIDPRGEEVDYRRISDKARSVARGVLEAILVFIYTKGSQAYE